MTRHLSRREQRQLERQSGSPRGRAAPARDRGMNRGESRYAAHLETLRVAGVIARWDYEPMGLRLADRTFYHPDFRVILPDGLIQMHECKGAQTDGEPFVLEKANIKLKVAAELHPFTFFLVWPKKGGGWNVREI
jgi:hypothetical protein